MRNIIQYTLFEGVHISTINFILQCTHIIQVSDAGTLQMSEAEAKPYVEEDSYNLLIT